jgi:protein tyrosine/serine phosphatase
MWHLIRVSVVVFTPLFVPTWAADIHMIGIPNFHRVDSHVYRGGQPSPSSWNDLAALRIRTVVDLRRDAENHEHSTKMEADSVEAAGMRYINLPMDRMAAPTSGQMSKLLALLGSDGVIFVHCRSGRDRTGVVIACYRVAHDHWRNQKALEEATSYGMHLFERDEKLHLATSTRA